MTGNARKQVYVGTTPRGTHGSVPDWCGNWNDAGPLIRKYHLDVMHSWDHVYIRDSKDSHTRKDVSATEDEVYLNEQIRIGIVQATIHSLETEPKILKEQANAKDTV